MVLVLEGKKLETKYMITEKNMRGVCKEDKTCECI